MSDDEIVQQKHLGMMSYVMKHIHQRDMLKLWEEFLRRFKLEVLIDKENGYIYLKSFLWYTDAKLPEEKQSELGQILTKYLSEEEQGNIMRTIAQKYIDEGKAEIVKNLLKAGLSVDFITQSTGLSRSQIESLSK